LRFFKDFPESKLENFVDSPAELMPPTV